MYLVVIKTTHGHTNHSSIQECFAIDVQEDTNKKLKPPPAQRDTSTEKQHSLPQRDNKHTIN